MTSKKLYRDQVFTAHFGVLARGGPSAARTTRPGAAAGIHGGPTGADRMTVATDAARSSLATTFRLLALGVVLEEVVTGRSNVAVVERTDEPFGDDTHRRLVGKERLDRFRSARPGPLTKPAPSLEHGMGRERRNPDFTRIRVLARARAETWPPPLRSGRRRDPRRRGLPPPRLARAELIRCMINILIQETIATGAAIQARGRCRGGR